jgi:hypothetical protein
MKIKFIHIVLIVALLVGIVVFTVTDSVVPYSTDTLFSHMYKYEGMTPQDNVAVPSQNPFNAFAEQNVKPPAPLSSSEFTSIMGDSGKKETQKEGLLGDNANEKKMVEGFDLRPSPLNASEVLDRFGNTPSGSKCFDQSSGYSNSLGPLCMSSEDIRMLSTRGGNISGTDSSIGK